jgi:hypothetical protein
MDAKELSVFVTPPKVTVREMLLRLTGGAIAILLVTAGSSFYKLDFRDGMLCFLVASLLGFVFFRKRKIALAISSLSCVLALGSLGFPFHPSISGLALLLASAGALYLTIRWSYVTYPYLSFKHIHAMWEGEAAMAAENARLEAEAREFNKIRPYGPWLFR